MNKLKQLILKTPKGAYLTGQEIADVIGISKSSLYSVYKNKKGLTLAEANTIAGEFDITLDEIVIAVSSNER